MSSRTKKAKEIVKNILIEISLFCPLMIFVNKHCTIARKKKEIWWY